MGDTAEAREAALNQTITNLVIQDGGEFLPFTESSDSQNDVDLLRVGDQMFMIMDRDGNGMFNAIAQQHGAMWPYTTGDGTTFRQDPPTYIDLATLPWGQDDLQSLSTDASFGV